MLSYRKDWLKKVFKKRDLNFSYASIEKLKNNYNIDRNNAFYSVIKITISYTLKVNIGLEL